MGPGRALWVWAWTGHGVASAGQADGQADERVSGRAGDKQAERIKRRQNKQARASRESTQMPLEVPASSSTATL